MSSTVITPPLLEIARDSGVRDALCALHAQLVPDGMACGESGWTIAPDDLPAIRHAVVAERRYAAADVTLTTRRVPSLRHVGLVAVHVLPTGSAQAPPARGFSAALGHEAGRLRLGLAVGLMETVRAHLNRRSAAGVPLMSQQLVKGMLAEATVDLLAAGARLDRPDLPEATVARAHAAITRAGRTLAGLLGASGYLIGDPCATLHASELIENVCVGAPQAPLKVAS
jgi:hypothetical protein